MSNTKEKIVFLADDLIRSRGFNAFSYYDISKSIGIKNAAIHYHFPTKTDLGLAVVNDHIRQFKDFAVLQENKKSIDKVKAFLNFYSQIASEKKICIIGALSTDWETLEGPIQDGMKQYTEQLNSWLISVLEEGKKDGTLNLKTSPETKALQIITNMIAATQLSKIKGLDGIQMLKITIINELIN
jgi:TetR/AcrR family transcriptional regulator, transcriptional repressor for nem operon